MGQYEQHSSEGTGIQPANRKSPIDRHRKISVAPMMDWTTRDYRYFARLITRHTLLYTEMVTTGALLHGDRARHLDFDAAEHPLALQLGGCDPHDLAECAAIAEGWGYDEVNLNCGCPSDRVQQGRFGACLMAEPELVAECVAAMRARVAIPVTVKTRIGIDDLDGYEHLHRFVSTVATAGCDTFVVHARKAWLSGLSPKENREIPPLRYEVVHRLRADFPRLTLCLNGGIRTLDEAEAQLEVLDGVMIGRAAYQNPYLLAEADRRIFGDARAVLAPHQVVEALIPYLERHLARGGQLAHVTRHLLGLFQGMPGARGWRRTLSENAHRHGAGLEVLRAALAHVPREAEAA